ncbi:MAG TPA: sulfatase-like hydrolase/transferase [Vicinamibacterales bacterium]|nr:sulfatase-like hydrolase/transferase [Vicinamibacterales bacterium]
MASQHVAPRTGDAMGVLHRGTLLLALTLVAVKAYYLGPPAAWDSAARYARALTATSSLDVLFTLVLWAAGVAALAGVARHPRVTRLIVAVYLMTGALAALYAVASVVMFGIFGGFLTYPLLTLVGDVRMLRSSVALHLTPGVAAGLVLLPTAYVAAALASRGLVTSRVSAIRGRAVSLALLLAWVLTGQYAYAREWTTRQDRRIAENAHWVLASSVLRSAVSDETVTLGDGFTDGDLGDFAPPVLSAATDRVRPARLLTRAGRSLAKPQAPPNVILVVLESVAARWTSLGNARYQTTPTLTAEAGHALVYDNFYAHIGRSSNSLAAILLSTYPKLDFQDVTEEYPELAGTSLASTFRDRGYRTSFVTSSDLSWAGWDSFIATRGFERVHDFHDLTCGEPVSSWGVEDRCMVDDMVQLVHEPHDRPFFMMAWSQQTHHPYEPSPGTAQLSLLREPVPYQYDVDRYLNVLHETDAQLARLFTAVREGGLADNTLIVITGDHGQAFGYPHDSYAQGRTIYEEDVNVPLMLWFPPRFRTAVRQGVIGSHVDLAPTIADVAGLPPAPDWLGRSLLDTSRAPRAYFYVAEDHFRLGVREGAWKYIYDLREGTEELYRLDLDPTEQRNVAPTERARCTRLRQRLAAWAEANRRQYVRADGKT